MPHIVLDGNSCNLTIWTSCRFGRKGGSRFYPNTAQTEVRAAQPCNKAYGKEARDG